VRKGRFTEEQMVAIYPRGGERAAEDDAGYGFICVGIAKLAAPSDEIMGLVASRTSDRPPVASARLAGYGSSNARSAAPRRYRLASHNEHGASHGLTLLGRKSNTRTLGTPAGFSPARCQRCSRGLAVRSPRDGTPCQARGWR